jgi:hypothetical protein
VEGLDMDTPQLSQPCFVERTASTIVSAVSVVLLWGSIIVLMAALP